MKGAIIGDIVGSVYEFHNIKTKAFPLWSPAGKFTDDSVMTVAVAMALMEGTDDRDRLLDAVTDYMHDYGNRYRHRGYGDRFRRCNFCLGLVGRFPFADIQVKGFLYRFYKALGNHGPGDMGTAYGAVSFFRFRQIHIHAQFMKPLQNLMKTAAAYATHIFQLISQHLIIYVYPIP